MAKATTQESSFDVMVMKFADSKVPLFKESRDRDYIKYGEDNLYPSYLTHLFNKSAKHNAIITGKASYIFGKGYANGDIVVNRNKESLNDVADKALLDIEIYGGCRFEVIYSKGGAIAEIYHVDFNCIRKAKDGSFLFKENWTINNRDDATPIPCFDPSIKIGSQIYEYNEYRPGIRFYPLPGYIGAINFIETDIEISKYYLSAIRNGFMPSKLVEFITAEMTDEKKREVERRWGAKFTGPEAAGKFIFATSPSKEKSINITDLSASDLDKQFIELNKTVQQEIFSGHNITSPMLFGIKTEGQLGGSTELNIAYSIFKNTYSQPKANAFDKEINWLLSFSIFKGEYKLQPTDPVGIQFDIKDVINSLPKVFVFEKLGIPKEMWNMDNIGSDSKPTQATPTGSNTEPTPGETAIAANDNIKNLSAKQHQQLMRIIRQYSKGQLTEQAAKALLRTGLGLNEDDINNILGIEQPIQMSAHDREESIIAMFDECGESRNDFEIVKSKKVSFSSVDEVEEDENIYIQEAFKDSKDLTATEAKLMELIKDDPLVTPSILAAATGETIKFIESKIRSLVSRGYIEEIEEKIGEDVLIKRVWPKGIKIDLPPVKRGAVNPTQIYIKYSYEGPQDSRNRPFCAKMMALNRLYSRYDIEKISQRLGYSVFDRRGGFWNHNGTIEPHCRHDWRSNIVVKKGGAQS